MHPDYQIQGNAAAGWQKYDVHMKKKKKGKKMIWTSTDLLIKTTDKAPYLRGINKDC